MERRTFRVKKTSGSTVFRITVPVEIGKQIEGVEFIPELTDDGLLYRPVTGKSRAPEPPPKWVPRALGRGR